MEWTWQITDFMVVGLKDENVRAYTQTHAHTRSCLFNTIALRIGRPLRPHIQTEQSLWEQTYMIVEASRSSTLTLWPLESPLNNLDPLGSARTYKSRSYDVIGVKGQGCNAYTASHPTKARFCWSCPEAGLLRNKDKARKMEWVLWWLLE